MGNPFKKKSEGKERNVGIIAFGNVDTEQPESDLFWPQIRLLVLSSMGSNYTNETATSVYDPWYALAPSDGPYTPLEPSFWYERNPGMLFPNGSKFTTANESFQPARPAIQ